MSNEPIKQFKIKHLVEKSLLHVGDQLVFHYCQRNPYKFAEAFVNEEHQMEWTWSNRVKVSDYPTTFMKDFSGGPFSWDKVLLKNKTNISLEGLRWYYHNKIRPISLYTKKNRKSMENEELIDITLLNPSDSPMKSILNLDDNTSATCNVTNNNNQPGTSTMTHICGSSTLNCTIQKLDNSPIVTRFMRRTRKNRNLQMNNSTLMSNQLNTITSNKKCALVAQSPIKRTPRTQYNKDIIYNDDSSSSSSSCSSNIYSSSDEYDSESSQYENMDDDERISDDDNDQSCNSEESIELIKSHKRKKNFSSTTNGQVNSKKKVLERLESSNSCSSISNIDNVNKLDSNVDKTFDKTFIQFVKQLADILQQNNNQSDQNNNSKNELFQLFCKPTYRKCAYQLYQYLQNKNDSELRKEVETGYVFEDWENRFLYEVIDSCSKSTTSNNESINIHECKNNDNMNDCKLLKPFIIGSPYPQLENNNTMINNTSNKLMKDKNYRLIETNGNNTFVLNNFRTKYNRKPKITNKSPVKSIQKQFIACKNHPKNRRKVCVYPTKNNSANVGETEMIYFSNRRGSRKQRDSLRKYREWQSAVQEKKKELLELQKQPTSLASLINDITDSSTPLFNSNFVIKENSAGMFVLNGKLCSV
ncbi:hypothetical protein ABK040_014680 [Willaertia magna]